MSRRNEITIELNLKSIQNAITKLKTYQRTLDRKARQICDGLADVGATECRAIVASIPATEDLGSLSVSIEKAKGGSGAYSATIHLKGEQVAFVEFSAGITFGTTTFPSIPGQTHALDPEGWDYWVDGVHKHTYGNRAYMPMYYSDMAIRREVLNVARKVFAIR